MKKIILASLTSLLAAAAFGQTLPAPVASSQPATSNLQPATNPAPATDSAAAAASRAALNAAIAQAETPAAITTNSEPSLTGGLTLIAQTIYDAMPSNYAVAVYGTYAPSAPSSHKIGGGVLALWNINQYVGTGLGLDYLGSLYMPSANLKLQLPIKPIAWVGSSPFFTNFVLTPFVLGGIATPIAGAANDTRSIAGIASAGANLDVAQLWGGEVSLGAALTKWTGAGVDYSGNHYNFFVAWRHGF